MGLWGKVTTADSRPKFLPVDSNAQGSSGSRQDAIAVSGGWALSPGHPNSGNDNKDAQPEVLVCIRNLADVFGSATPVSIGWTEGEVADTGTFDITVTFDEAVDVTSATRTANQTVTNKAHILLSRLGATDMVEDSTVACQYFSGSGTNQIVFRGLVQTNAAAGYLAFNGGGVGDAASEGRTAILFNGTADIEEEDGGSILGLMLEEGTRDVPGDKLVLNGTNGSSANAGDEIHVEGVDFTIAGSTGTADITDLTFTGGDSEVYVGLLEQGAGGDGEDKIILNGTDGSSSNANEGIVAEDYTSDIAVYTQAGSTSGTASVLNGVTVAASG
jgi:hypothetical protein